MRTLNKKASTSTSILILAVITLVLCAVALSVFVISKPAEKKISDVRFIENAYVKEEQAKFFLFQIGEYALEKTEPFDEAKFKENLKEEAEKYKDEDFVILSIKEAIENNKYKVNFNNGKLRLEFNDFEIIMRRAVKDKKINWVFILPLGTREEIKEMYGLVYLTDLKVEIK